MDHLVYEFKRSLLLLQNTHTLKQQSVIISINSNQSPGINCIYGMLVDSRELNSLQHSVNCNHQQQLYQSNIKPRPSYEEERELPYSIEVSLVIW